MPPAGRSRSVDRRMRHLPGAYYHGNAGPGVRSGRASGTERQGYKPLTAQRPRPQGFEVERNR
jgi:hypothetical protein